MVDCWARIGTNVYHPRYSVLAGIKRQQVTSMMRLRKYAHRSEFESFGVVGIDPNGRGIVDCLRHSSIGQSGELLYHGEGAGNSDLIARMLAVGHKNFLVIPLSSAAVVQPD